MTKEQLIEFFGSARKASEAAKEYGAENISENIISRWTKVPKEFLLVFKEIYILRLKIINLDIENEANNHVRTKD